MSMVLTRSPLEPIGMNGASVPKRRSARLSVEGADENENEHSGRQGQVNGVHTTTVNTKEQDGGAGAASKKKRKVYDEEDDGFAFTKSKRSKASKAPTVRNSNAERASPVKAVSAPPAEQAEPKTTQKKPRRRFPTTPERDEAEKPVRRSKRLSDENTTTAPKASPHKPAHARSHARHERSPSPFQARPVTVEKKRRKGTDGVEEEKIMRIQLPFADTPVIKRNKEMRKASAENGQRRSSSGMRGRRASSLIDEGRGNGEFGAVFSIATFDLKPAVLLVRIKLRLELIAWVSGLSTPPPSESAAAILPRTKKADQTLPEAIADEPVRDLALPHSEVPAAEFFKHISAELTEPRRMRCLLGWCGSRALPQKPEAPEDSTSTSSLDFQALQAARVIEEELSQDLVSKGILSDWFSRDESTPPQIPLRKKPNPRNVLNAEKAEELERELERLKQQRAEWDELIASAAPVSSPPRKQTDQEAPLSPLNPELLDSPQRALLEQFQGTTTESSTEPTAIQQRLRNITENLEFTVDQFAHGIHALSTTKETAERLADRSLADAANVLEEREKRQRIDGKAVDPMDALKGLAKVLNGRHR